LKNIGPGVWCVRGHTCLASIDGIHDQRMLT